MLNCYRCGRFVGKDGDPDISRAFCGEPAEIGYPRCGRCVREDQADQQQRQQDTEARP